MLQITLKDGAQTRLLIARQGESLRKFSDKIGISQGYLSQILSMKNKPSANVAYKIANGLNVDIEEIFLVKVNDISFGVEVI